MQSSASDRVTRLVRLARVWAAVRYLHPWMLSREIDLDRPLLSAISEVDEADSDHEFASVVAKMLGTLGDTATRVVTKHGDDTPRADSKIPTLLEWREDIAILRAGAFAAANGVSALFFALAGVSGLERARGVVVDLRCAGAEAEEIEAVRGVLDEALHLPGRKYELPGRRYVQHSGYRPQTGRTSGGYFSGFLCLPSSVQEDKREIPNGRVVFVAGRLPRVPLMAFGLRSSGDAVIVAEEPFGEEAVVEIQPVEITGGHSAWIRVAELILPNGWKGVAADVIVRPECERDAALESAIALAGQERDSERPLPAPAAGPLPDASWHPDNAYREMTLPDQPHRLLAAFRIWSIIDRFYPYKHLLDNWDAVLPEFIPTFEAADTADAYAHAVLAMTARIDDGHTRAVGHPSVLQYFGGARLPIQIRWIEQHFVVTAALAPALEAGIQLGDVLVAIDGEPMLERVARLRKFFTASTEIARLARIAGTALRGPKNSVAILELRAPDGSLRTISMPRLERTALPQRSDEAFHLLAGNIGYADLTRLTGAEVDRMFEALGTTNAIIFDMRGYPNGTAWQIAPRINTNGAKVTATIRRPQLLGNNADEAASSNLVFEQKMPEASGSLYRGRTFMLIDERTISQAEHTGLFFEVANGTEFIGTPSAGANGDTTDFTLPGGFVVSFTGHDVRHADGRQLQRIGLLPHLVVEPTILGISAGRDEVFDAAIAYAAKAISHSETNT